jgi:hypothetical protein
MNTWSVQGFDSTLTFSGDLIGEASSQRRRHTEHDQPFAAPGLRCSACRWFEVRIFRTADLEYVVEMTGQTIVDGERVRHRVETTASPYWVIDILTQHDAERRFIPIVSKRALAEAAARDVAIESAYVARVVA